MKDRLQTQLFGPYFGSFSAHSYGYELSSDPKSVRNLLDFRFGPILGRPPSVVSYVKCMVSRRIFCLINEKNSRLAVA